MRNTALGMICGLLGIVALPAASAAQVLGTPVQPPRAIHVSATGQVQVAPDEAQISFAVESFAATAEEAGQQNAQTMQKVLAALVDAGVPRDSLETQNYSIRPEYVPNDQDDTQRIRGYRARNQVVAKTTQLDQVGSLIDVALAAGANRFNGVNFLVRDTRGAEARALSQAVQQARTTAETIARTLGVTLGPVLQVSTSTGGGAPVPMYARASMAEYAAAPTPIQPSQQTVAAQASVSFAIGAQP